MCRCSSIASVLNMFAKRWRNAVSISGTTHYGAWNFSESENGEVILDPAPGHGGKINYETFIEALHQHGYDGYLTSEYCLPVLRDHKLCGIEDIDEATRRGLRFMKQLVQRVTAEKKPVTSKAALA